MALESLVTPDGSVDIVAILTVLVRLAGVGYGLLVVPTSGLGGAWIVSIGLSLCLSGLFTTEWTGDRFDISAATRHRLSLAFGILAVVLLVAFAIVNGATFEASELEGSS